MLVDDQVVAQTFFLIENGIAIAYRIGMGDLYPKHSPGLAVIALSMDHMEDMGIRLLDMGPGGPDDYKRSIGGLEMLSLGVSATAVLLLFSQGCRNIFRQLPTNKFLDPHPGYTLLSLRPLVSTPAVLGPLRGGPPPTSWRRRDVPWDFQILIQGELAHDRP